MNNEKDDPDDVIYGIDGIKMSTQKAEYLNMREMYVDRLGDEIASISFDFFDDNINSEILENHKCKIMLYSNIITLIDFAIKNDTRELRNTIYSISNELQKEDCDLDKISTKFNKKTAKIKKKMSNRTYL